MPWAGTGEQPGTNQQGGRSVLDAALRAVGQQELSGRPRQPASPCGASISGPQLTHIQIETRARLTSAGWTGPTTAAVGPPIRSARIREFNVSKKFLTEVIADSAGMPVTQAGRVAADVIAAIKREIIETGRFTLPEFGSFSVRETKARTGLNPRTGEKVKVKAGATVRFKASPNLKEAALAGLKKAKRKAAKA